jgi:phosphoenolpyruvate carboxykinase (ATP)
VADFLRGRRVFLEEFESRWGKIPGQIRESLPYREDKIDTRSLHKKGSQNADGEG